MGELTLNNIPEYKDGRFFISPILGCNAQCKFCYIYGEGYAKRISLNSFSISNTIDYLKSNSNFVSGKEGSIISIGAWGDPLPKYHPKACNFTIDWLAELSKLGNPIQIMSRYEVENKYLHNLSQLNRYNGHILYSTSITSFSKYREIEPYSDSPEKRLETVSRASQLGLATNVLVKPFISGITDLEAEDFITYFNKYDVKYCVVGKLMLDDENKKQLERLGILNNIGDIPIAQTMDCNPSHNYGLALDNKIETFEESLNGAGIKAFRKSSCVNSFILSQPNPANYFHFDPNGYCINCGVC